MIDYRIINFSHSLRDLETGQAAERFYRTLSSHHKEIDLRGVSSNVDQWKLKDKTDDGSVWIFEDKVEVKIDSPPIDRGKHRFARLRSIYIDKDKRGFSLAPIRRCIASIQETLEDLGLPLFLVVKPYEEERGKEVYHNCLKRQQALVSLMLSLGFKHMDRDTWNIKAEGSTAYFEERNKDYPLEIPFLIWLPMSCTKEKSTYFISMWQTTNCQSYEDS